MGYQFWLKYCHFYLFIFYCKWGWQVFLNITTSQILSMNNCKLFSSTYQLPPLFFFSFSLYFLAFVDKCMGPQYLFPFITHSVLTRLWIHSFHSVYIFSYYFSYTESPCLTLPTQYLFILEAHLISLLHIKHPPSMLLTDISIPVFLYQLTTPNY